MSADIKEPCSFWIHISMTTVVKPYSDFYIEVSAHKQCLCEGFSFFFLSCVLVCCLTLHLSPNHKLSLSCIYILDCMIDVTQAKRLCNHSQIHYTYTITNVSTVTPWQMDHEKVHDFGWNQYPGPHDSFSVQNTNSHLGHRNLHNLNFFLFVLLSSICLWVVKNL